jgi:hypothetical protein
MGPGPDIRIPTGTFNDQSNLNHNRSGSGCAFFEDEEFCFGSPQKRNTFGANEDNLTQESTPEKDMAFGKVSGPPSSFTSMSDENQSHFSD